MNSTKWNAALDKVRDVSNILYQLSFPKCFFIINSLRITETTIYSAFVLKQTLKLHETMHN